VEAAAAGVLRAPLRNATEQGAGPITGSGSHSSTPTGQRYADWPVIASIEDLGGNVEESVPFALEGCTRLRVYGTGAGSRWGMEDLAYVQNADTGQVIWRVFGFGTTQRSAGIREIDRPLTLVAGSYRLYFSTQPRTRQPPGEAAVGITLYEDRTPGSSPAVCWPRAARPEDLGWSARKLRRIASELQRMDCAALMIVTDGQVVLEWGHTANNFAAHSMRKSLLSALYGVYVSEGAIDTSRTLAELGIDDKTPLTELEMQATITDLLKARSGVYIPAAGEVASMREARPERGGHPPGTFWYYNNWDFNALGTIFDQETGEDSIYQAFQSRIAGPIGMQDLQTERLQYSYEPYSVHPYYGYRISARDLARFGQLYLQEGAWDGAQIVPAAWVRESTLPYSRTGGSGTYSGYGYMWWIAAEDAGAIAQGSYAASGYGGHTLEVLPQINTVIVFRVNTDDPSARLAAGSSVDQLIGRILRASNRVADPHRSIERALAGWAGLVVGSLGVLGWNAWRHRGQGDSTEWALPILMFGPLALLAYQASLQRSRAGWRALGATLYHGAGYALAWASVQIIFRTLWPSRPPLFTLLIMYGVPFTVGLLAFRASFLSKHLDAGYGTALRKGIPVEAISTALSLAGATPITILALDRWWHGALAGLDVPLPFVLTTLAITFASMVPLYPFHLWMVRHGFASWPGGSDIATARQEDALAPSWRDARAPLWISLVLLIASIVSSVLFLT
jgi:CubicO group peptidase (beta-lactamase class C family)